MGAFGGTSYRHPRRPVDVLGAATSAAGLTILLLLAFGFARVAATQTLPSPAFVVAGGIAMLGLLALALARYDAAVALGLVLLGVVNSDPAPSDAVFLVVILVAAATGRFEVDRVPVTVSLSIAVLVVLNVLSALAAVDAGIAAAFFATTLYLAVFGLWLAGYVSSFGRARLVAVAYLVAAASSALLGSLALLTPLPGRETFLLEGCCRAQGLFQDPNVFGPFLIPAALIIMQELVAPRLLRVRPSLKVALLALLLTGVVLSFSRAAWLNLGVALAVLLPVLALRRQGGRRAGALVAVLLAVAALTGAVVALAGSSEFLLQRTTLQAYDAERFAAQRSGIDLAQRFPLGIGPGQFEVVEPVASHNTYIRVLAEQGVLGVAALVALFLATLALAGRNAVVGRDTFGIGSAALLAAWCGLLVNSLFIDTLHWRHLWLVAALVWAGSARGLPLGRR